MLKFLPILFLILFLSCGGNGGGGNNYNNEEKPNSFLEENQLDNSNNNFNNNNDFNNNLSNSDSNFKLYIKTFTVYVDAMYKADSSNSLVSYRKEDMIQYNPCRQINDNEYKCTITYTSDEVENNLKIILTYNFELFNIVSLNELNIDPNASFVISEETTYSSLENSIIFTNLQSKNNTNGNMDNNFNEYNENLYYLNITNCTF